MEKLEINKEYKLNPKKDSKDLVLYRPRNSSIELAVESYSAMRYHGQ